MLVYKQGIWESDDRISMNTVAKYKVIARDDYWQW